MIVTSVYSKNKGIEKLNNKFEVARDSSGKFKSSGKPTIKERREMSKRLECIRLLFRYHFIRADVFLCMSIVSFCFGNMFIAFGALTVSFLFYFFAVSKFYESKMIERVLNRSLKH